MARRAAPRVMGHQSVFQDIIGFVKSSVADLRIDSTSVPTVSNEREHVTWVKFERDGSTTLLLLGYTDGFQVWDIHDQENIREIYSRRGFVCTSASLLATPRVHDNDYDSFAHRRPIIACVVESDLSTPLSRTSVSSASSGAMTQLQLHSLAENCTIEWNAPTLDAAADNAPTRVLSNPSVVAVVYTMGVVDVLCARSLTLLSRVTDGAIGLDAQQQRFNTPVAVGASWLAYASTTRDRHDVASAGRSLDADNGLGMADVVRVAQETGAGLLQLSGKGIKRVSDMVNGTTSVAGSPPSLHPHRRTHTRHTASPTLSASSVESQQGGDGIRASSSTANGTVTVVDARGVALTRFQATHGDRPLVAMTFDGSGLLLATSCMDGQFVNVFGLATHDGNRLSPTHLYKLERGLTMAFVHDIVFSRDSRWLSVVSNHGTTHVFAINPDGQEATAKTHASANRSQKFETSSGLSDLSDSVSWRHITRKSPMVVHGASVKLREYDREHRSARSVSGSAPSLFAAAHAAAAVMFSSDGNGSARHMATGSRPQVLTVATVDGFLFEHRLYPHDANDHAAVRRIRETIDADDGIVVGDHGALAGVEHVVHSTVNTVGSVLSGVRSVVTGLKHDESPMVLQAHRSRLGVLCDVKRGWDLCREMSWAETSSDTSFVGAQQREMERSDRNRSAGDGGENRWLGHAVLRSYPTPHRRLWMGPQFGFHTITSGKDTSADALQCPSMFVPEAKCEGDVLSSGFVTSHVGVKSALTSTRMSQVPTDIAENTDITSELAEALQIE